MFERKEPFPWRIPVMILVGVAVLSGGIYLGFKSINNEKKPEEVSKAQTNKKENIKEVFGLSKDCEIWLHKKNSGESKSNELPVMIGTVDEELLDMTEKEIIAYLNDKYPDRQVESVSKYEIVLSETVDEQNNTDISKFNKYSLELDNEYLALYKYGDDGSKELIEKTEIRIDSLPSSIQDDVKKGITLDTEEEAYSQLESLGS